MKVLHYKTVFLAPSETFIQRLIENHERYKPAAMCVDKRQLTGDYPIAEKPGGWAGLYNTLCFHLNWCLPFYTKTIQSFAPDIVHAHFGFDGYRMIKPSQRTNTPLVVSFHGSDVWRLPSEFDWPRRYRKLARHADAFTAVSELMKNKLAALGFPEKKIHVVRCGLPLHKFSFTTDYSPNRNLMMVGRMVEKKGFIYALKAIHILHEKGYHTHLDLFGDGPLAPELHQKVQDWNISDYITFHGFQPNAKIRRAFQNHSALLVPSVTASDGDREGLPITMLEAMASGLPVIATRHSAIPEAVTHQKTGFLVEEKDAPALARAIRQVQTGKADLRRLRHKAREYVAQHHDIHQMVRKTEVIYDEILRQRNHRKQAKY